MSRHFIASIPLAISSVRVLVGLAFAWIPVEWRLPAVVLAAFSDVIDGPIARRLKVDGGFGQIVDPIVDKICLAGILLTLLFEGSLAWSEVLLVGLRDWGIVLAGAGILFFSAERKLPIVAARWPGKITTVLQITYVLLLLYGTSWAGFLVIPTAVVGAIALADYAVAVYGLRNESHTCLPRDWSI